MDQDLKTYLEGMETRITDRVVDRVAERVGGRIDASEERMKEYVGRQIEASETRLLGEFWKWARTADARYRQNQGDVTGLAERVTIVEDRIAELERGRDTAA